MEQIVTITRQGQLTIPQSVRTKLGIIHSTKARLRTEGKTIIVEPTSDFWSLAGSLHSDIVLTPSQLRQARQSFMKQWARPV